MTDKRFTLEELSGISELQGRTIRFYISEGLLPGATYQGCAKAYTQVHVDRLLQIQQHRALGMTLDKIREELLKQGVAPPWKPPVPRPPKGPWPIWPRPPKKPGPIWPRPPVPPAPPYKWEEYPLQPGVRVSLWAGFPQDYKDRIVHALEKASESVTDVDREEEWK